MDNLNKVKVVIAGEIVALKSMEKPEHMHNVAQYLDNKINEISNASDAPILDERTRSMRIMLNIADEHLKKMGSITGLEKDAKKNAREIEKLREENEILKQRVENLQAELDQTKEEFEDFLQTFDSDEVPKADNILTLPIKTAN